MVLKANFAHLFGSLRPFWGLQQSHYNTSEIIIVLTLAVVGKSADTLSRNQKSGTLPLPNKEKVYSRMSLMKQYKLLFLLNFNPQVDVLLIFCVTKWEVHIKHAEVVISRKTRLSCELTKAV